MIDIKKHITLPKPLESSEFWKNKIKSNNKYKSGSNAYLLSGELATLLSGIYI